MIARIPQYVHIQLVTPMVDTFPTCATESQGTMKPVDSARERDAVAKPATALSSDWAPRSLFDLHRVKQFEAVARHLNITRAANELYLSQQAVSASIKSLERDLGVLLFDRVGRHLELTPSGIALREGASSLLDAASALTRRIHDAHRPRHRPLVLAFTPDVSADDIADLAASALEALPLATITTRQVQPSDIRNELRKGQADVALSRGMPEADHLASSIVGHTALSVAVASDHRLAGRGRIDFADLADDTLALPGGPENPYAGVLFAICRQAGLNPVTVKAAVQGVSPTASVIGTPHYTLVTAEPGFYHRGRVAVLSVLPTPIAPLHALWLPHTENPLHLALIDVHRSSRTATRSADRPLEVRESLRHCPKPGA